MGGGYGPSGSGNNLPAPAPRAQGRLPAYRAGYGQQQQVQYGGEEEYGYEGGGYEQEVAGGYGARPGSSGGYGLGVRGVGAGAARGVGPAVGRTAGGRAVPSSAAASSSQAGPKPMSSGFRPVYD